MLTLPNLLTLSRIIAVPLLAGLLWWPHWQGGYAIAFALYCLMGITDYFDGYLARAQGAVSKLGQFLDPIADKIMIAAVILVLAAQGVLTGPYVGDMHVIAGLVILIREIAVSGLREFLGGLRGDHLPRRVRGLLERGTQHTQVQVDDMLDMVEGFGTGVGQPAPRCA
jgi:CDP-diacylglycerol--glycerol-3-phosphate 3-phosphatidyltransferase/cardiolipin synthase